MQSEVKKFQAEANDKAVDELVQELRHEALMRVEARRERDERRWFPGLDGDVSCLSDSDEEGSEGSSEQGEY